MMGPWRRAAAAALVLFAAVLLGGCFHSGDEDAAPAGEGGSSGAPIEDPYPEGRRTSERARLAAVAPTSDATWRVLRRKAGSARTGRVRLIVALRLPTRREGLLSDVQRTLQRASIARARDRLLALIPGAQNVRTFDAIPYLIMDVDARVLSVLRRLPSVLAAGEGRAWPLRDPLPRPAGQNPAQAQTGENESFNQALEDWWHYFQTNLDDANKAGFTGANQAVAIVDTGVQANHPWFQGKVVEEACFARLEDTGSQGGACPNQTARQIGPGSAVPCTYHIACFHGTHVAGVAAGKFGLAPAAKVIAIQVFHPTEERPSVNEYDMIDALNHVASLTARYRIAAVNFSLGGGQFAQHCDSDVVTATALRDAVQVLVDRGVAMVAASGNDGYEEAIGFPACISNAISVGNTTLGCDVVDEYAGSCPTLEDKVFHESNSVSFLSLLAPGTHLCSSSTIGIPGVELPANLRCTQDDATWQVNGTSQAAPHVSGAIALLKQYAAENNKDARVATLLGVLQSSGTAVSGKGETKTRIDVWAALNWMHCGRVLCQ